MFRSFVCNFVAAPLVELRKASKIHGLRSVMEVGFCEAQGRSWHRRFSNMRLFCLHMQRYRRRLINYRLISLGGQPHVRAGQPLQLSLPTGMR